MILPGKHLAPDRSLLSVGSEIVAQLDRPRDVSDVWDRVRAARASRPAAAPLSFDTFVMASSMLYAIGAIDDVGGRLARRSPGK